jgi:hypothetical protein
MTEAFVRNIQQFVSDEGIDSGCFRQGATQGRRHAALLRRLPNREGALSVSKAAEEGARHAHGARPLRSTTGATYIHTRFGGTFLMI